MGSPPIGDVALNQTFAHAIARACIRPLLGTWVRPNHLTLLRLITGGAACILLASPGRNALVVSGILWTAACFLDRADGELARVGNLRSYSGKVLDYYSDMILDAGWFLGAGIGLAHGSMGGIAVLLGSLTAVCLIICSWSAESLERLSDPGTKAYYGFERFHPDDALFLLPIGTWLGWTAAMLIGASVVTPVIATITIFRYVAVKRRVRPSHL